MSQTEQQAQPIRFDDRAAFQAWAERQPGARWERERGVPVAMAPERIAHTRVKYAAWLALRDALRRAGSPCEAIGNGVTVEVDDDTDYEPDALVVYGDPADGRWTGIGNPTVVVEVLSPSTGLRDQTDKLAGYFRVPTVQHYLLLQSGAVQVIHHRRWTEGRLLTRIANEGTLELDPPGITVTVAELYRDTGLPGTLRG